MIERIGDGNDGLAAIFPAMLNSMIALRCLGYSADHPLYRKAEGDFEELFVEDERDFASNPALLRSGIRLLRHSFWRAQV